MTMNIHRGRVSPTVLANADEIGDVTGRIVADRIEATQGGRFLLGCPGGRSPMPTYVGLAAEVARRRLDLSAVTILMMDDYLVPSTNGAWCRANPAEMHSCERFGRKEIFDPLSRAAGPGRGPRDLWMPNPDDPKEYDQRISAAGGIDLFLLASGASDGHVAFNPPGTEEASTTRIVRLPETTRRDNLLTFPSFGDDLSAVPEHGITVGLKTIREQSREVIMLCHGQGKGHAVQRLMEAEALETDWPASVFTECENPQFFIDQAAYAAATVGTDSDSVADTAPAKGL